MGQDSSSQISNHHHPNKHSKREDSRSARLPDQGHRYGNFSNYYSFNPPSNRMKLMEGILKHITASLTTSKETTFSYCDVGCNEGDLTIQVAKELMDSKTMPSIAVRGLDLDEKLIKRAKQKFPPTSQMPNVEFVTANVCNLKALEEHVPKDLNLLTIFSTTMWIHIHAGDDGLRRILQALCRKTKDFIVIEPQASKSYRSAAARLRKQGLEPIDVSTDRQRATMQSLRV